MIIWKKTKFYGKIPYIIKDSHSDAQQGPRKNIRKDKQHP